MCDPSGGSRQAPREFFNPLTESDSFTLKWESGRASLWTVCFRSIEKPQLHLSSVTHKCVRAHMHIHRHTCSFTLDTWEFTLLQVTQLVFQTVGLLCPLWASELCVCVCECACVCVWLNELWGVRKGCWSGSVWLLAECFSTSHYSYLPNDCWPEQIWSPTGSHQQTGPTLQINAARGMRCQISAPSSKNFLILWRGGSKSDPRSASVPAQGRQGFLKFMVAARESTGLLIASRKWVGRNPLMIHTIIFLSGKYCGWGGERLSSSLLSSLFHCLFHTAKTSALFADLM